MPSSPDVVVCLAHRRWSCFYERSQHLMSQCAQERRAIYVEEPEFDTSGPDVELSETRTGVITLIPHLPSTLTYDAVRRAQRRALELVLAHLDCHRPVLWYYAPQAIAFTDHIDASAIVYDWIDFDMHGIPTLGMGKSHQKLLDTADVVFTDGNPDHRQLVHHNVVPIGPDVTAPDAWQMMWGRVEQAIADRAALRVTAPRTA
jgi:UDP-galactopyranose mutase